MGYKSNRHVLYTCKYHVVFCPKYRRKVSVSGVDKRLKQILDQLAKELGCDVMELEIMPDHVHILCEVDPQFGVHKFVKRNKGLSSRLLRQEFPQLKSRLPTMWTHSYFISTVGGAPTAILKPYIENQKNV
jgi:putative transposase